MHQSLIQITFRRNAKGGRFRALVWPGQDFWGPVKTMLRKYTRPLCKSLSRQSQREEHFGALARPDQDFGGPVKAMQRKCTRPVFKSLFGRAQRGGHLEHWSGKTKISDVLSNLYWKTLQDPIQEDLLRKQLCRRPSFKWQIRTPIIWSSIFRQNTNPSKKTH